LIRLFNRETKGLIGTIAEGDLKTLIDQLEEEHAQDADYYLTADTIEILRTRGASAELVSMLRQALGDAEGIEIAWERS
jgi:hypothetical protein